MEIDQANEVDIINEEGASGNNEDCNDSSNSMDIEFTEILLEKDEKCFERKEEVDYMKEEEKGKDLIEEEDNKENMNVPMPGETKHIVIEEKEKQLMPPPQPNIQRAKELQLSKRRVIFIMPQSLPHVSNLIHKRDYKMIFDLHNAYGLFQKMKVIICKKPAEYEDLVKFHSEDYIQFLKELSRNGFNEANEDDTRLEDYGLNDDLEDEQYKQLYSHVQIVAGTSLLAARTLVADECDVAINWLGGRHHGKKTFSSGYCYVNDVVLSILKLKEKFAKVMYIDLDAHHGDGVEEAFSYSSDVLTLSLHNYQPGFFPHSGSIKSIGKGDGKYCTVNVPLKEGVNDATYVGLFKFIFNECLAVFKADCVVVQCGADCLGGDPLGKMNLTIKGLGECVKHILAIRRPVLILGGGGYNAENTSRCWTYLSSIAISQNLPFDIPEHNYIEKYKPNFQLFPKDLKKENLNTKEYINEVALKIKSNLQLLLQSQISNDDRSLL